MDNKRRLAIQTIAGMDQIATFLESEDDAQREFAVEAIREMFSEGIKQDDFVIGLFNCVRQSAEKTAQGEHDEPEDST